MLDKIYDSALLEDKYLNLIFSVVTDWEWPTDLKQTSSFFGYRYYGGRDWHDGIDIPVKVGTAVKSVANGTVITSKLLTGYGDTLDVDHGNMFGKKVVTRYAHLKDLKTAVAKDSEVNQGDTIAQSGKAGTGAHLHFELFVYYVDAGSNIKHLIRLNPHYILTGGTDVVQIDYGRR